MIYKLQYVLFIHTFIDSNCFRVSWSSINLSYDGEWLTWWILSQWYDMFPFPVAGALEEGNHEDPRFLPVSVSGIKLPSAAPSRCGSLRSVGVSVVYSPAVRYLPSLRTVERFQPSIPLYITLHIRRRASTRFEIGSRASLGRKRRTRNTFWAL